MKENNFTSVQEHMVKIKFSLNQNPKKVIQDVISSLRLKTGRKKDPYEIDLTLAILKTIYEECFPETKKGAHLKKIRRKHSQKPISDDSSLIEEYPQKFSLAYRTIIINLLEGIYSPLKKPSFVSLISYKSTLTKRTIYKYIFGGIHIIRGDVDSEIVLLYKKNEISPYQMTRKIKGNENVNKIR